MLRGTALRIGKATKRSRFGDDAFNQTSRTFEAAEFCIKAGFDFHFIDAERKQDYVKPSELDNLLVLGEENGSNLSTVLTINARHLMAFDVFKGYAEVMSQHEKSGLCFVAGNPAYLSMQERQADAKSRIRQLVRMTRERLQFTPIFIGSEGHLDLANELSATHRAIPFMLLDPSLQDKVHRMDFAQASGEFAVYCPCSLSEAESDQSLIETLGPYALRRKWVRESLRRVGLSASAVRNQISNGGALEKSASKILTEAIHALAPCDIGEVHDVADKFSSLGMRYVAFLSATENWKEFESLHQALSESEASEIE